MNDHEFETFIKESLDWLNKAQEELHFRYGISRYEKYWFDQESGKLQFKNGDQVQLEFSFIGIGSWNSEHNNYRWAWANESVTDQGRRASSRLCELAEITDRSIFEQESFECDGSMAWEIAAMCARHLGAIGVYKAPHGEHLHLFLVLMAPN